MRILKIWYLILSMAVFSLPPASFAQNNQLSSETLEDEYLETDEDYYEDSESEESDDTNSDETAFLDEGDVFTLNVDDAD